MPPDQAEDLLRSLLAELQRTGELISTVDVRALSLDATLEELGLDALARHTLAAMIEDIVDAELDGIDDAATTLRDLLGHLCAR
jgi:hypothetical protein